MRYFLLILMVLTGFSPIVLADKIQDKPFVVVELFSSEGCSSCPPADLLVSQLTTWARQNSEPVYPLIFHVDYWNNLGWEDVFSSPEFTQRQYHYAHVLKDQGVYTPEMIVNGVDAFVGSNQAHLQKDLDSLLTIPANVIVHISLKKQGGNIIVTFSSEGFDKGDVVNIALVERGISSQVTAGENEGSLLRHDNLVREFRTLPLNEAPSQVNVPLQKVSDLSQASVIAYVQNSQTMLIKAAAQLDLKNV